MNVTPELYQDMQKQVTPPTKSYLTIPTAFLVGGLICMFGEMLLHLYEFLGMSAETGGIMVSITLIFLSILCTGLGWYQKLARYAGAGTLVPITGFANAVSCCAIEGRAEGWILGIGAKLFIISGPVIVYGTAASVVYGVIYYFLTL